MIILGIDPGFRIAGYALARRSNGKTVVFDYGYLKLDPKRDIATRTFDFYTFFQEKIIEHQVTHLALETPFLGKNVQSFVKLGYLRGVLNLLSKQHDMVLTEFTPRQVKQAVTGFGGASKEQVATMVMRLFPKLNELGKTFKQDVTDALAVCMCGLWAS